MEQTVEIKVDEYYARPWYYPFMPDSVFKALEDAFLADEPTAIVDRIDYELMMSKYHNQLAN